MEYGFNFYLQDKLYQERDDLNQIQNKTKTKMIVTKKFKSYDKRITGWGNVPIDKIVLNRNPKIGLSNFLCLENVKRTIPYFYKEKTTLIFI